MAGVAILLRGGKGKSRGKDPGFILLERLAATYSRASYTGTTIGKTAFDGRVRNGNGSDHSFMATKNLKEQCSLKTTHRQNNQQPGFTIRELKIASVCRSKQKQSSLTTD